jgi:hypothetical protein
MKRIEVESHDLQFFKMLIQEKLEAGWMIESEVEVVRDESGRAIQYKQILFRL